MLTTGGFNSLLAGYLLALESPHYDHTSPNDRAISLRKLEQAAENVRKHHIKIESTAQALQAKISGISDVRSNLVRFLFHFSLILLSNS